MKKYLALILSLALAACVFAGCSSKEEAPEPAPEQDVWATYEADFTNEQTYGMSNFMMYGRYVVEDGVIYGLTHDEGHLQGALGARSFEMEGSFPKFGALTVLDDRADASYLLRAGEYLYYISGRSEICRIKLDGSGRETLYEGACDYLSTHDNKLYFTDASYHLVCTDMDGKNLTTVVNKEVYFPYFICSDWMVFQDDADNESLHLYNVVNGTEANITDGQAFNPILDGKYLYYVIETADGCQLCRADISDPKNIVHESGEGKLLSGEYLIDEGFIYASNNYNVAKDNWKKLSVYDATSIDMLEMYTSEDYSIHHELNEEGLIMGKYLTNKEKGGGTSFA